MNEICIYSAIFNYTAITDRCVNYTLPRAFNLYSVYFYFLTLLKGSNKL